MAGGAVKGNTRVGGGGGGTSSVVAWGKDLCSFLTRSCIYVTRLLTQVMLDCCKILYVVACSWALDITTEADSGHSQNLTCLPLHAALRR